MIHLTQVFAHVIPQQAKGYPTLAHIAGKPLDQLVDRDLARHLGPGKVTMGTVSTSARAWKKGDVEIYMDSSTAGIYDFFRITKRDRSKALNPQITKSVSPWIALLLTCSDKTLVSELSGKCFVPKREGSYFERTFSFMRGKQTHKMEVSVYGPGTERGVVILIN